MNRRSSLSRRCRDLLLRSVPRLFARHATPDTEELGRLGEELAARALADRGWIIVGRRLDTPWAEVDVVALDAGELVCVEVKAGRLPDRPAHGRSSAHLGRAASAGTDPRAGPGPRSRPGPHPRPGLRFRPGLRLDRERLARLAGASRWLAHRLPSTRGEGGRVDLVEVVLRGVPPRIELHHHARLRAPLPAPPPPDSR